MHRVLLTAVMSVPLLVTALFSNVAQAQVRKNVSEYAGQRCNTPPRGSGVIVGQFSGVDDSPFVSSDGLVPVDRFRCFQTISECKGWLYTMQSKYTNAGAATVVRCTKR